MWSGVRVWIWICCVVRHMLCAVGHVLRVRARAQVCVFVCARARVRACVRVCACARVCAFVRHTKRSVITCIRMRIHMCIRTRMRICM